MLCEKGNIAILTSGDRLSVYQCNLRRHRFRGGQSSRFGKQNIRRCHVEMRFRGKIQYMHPLCIGISIPECLLQLFIGSPQDIQMGILAGLLHQLRRHAFHTAVPHAARHHKDTGFICRNPQLLARFSFFRKLQEPLRYRNSRGNQLLRRDAAFDELRRQFLMRDKIVIHLCLLGKRDTGIIRGNKISLYVQLMLSQQPGHCLRREQMWHYHRIISVLCDIAAQLIRIQSVGKIHR